MINSYLDEMGLVNWQLVHPERIQGYHQSKIELPQNCKMLFISPSRPDHDFELFTKIIKSMKLELEHCYHIYSDKMQEIQYDSLDWIWFASKDADNFNAPADSVKLLRSPVLNQLQHNNVAKQALWQQIKFYNNQ